MSQTGSPKTRRSAWTRETLRDPHAQPDKAVRVEEMFDAIAPTYERVNTVATWGRDAAWRRTTVVAAGATANDVVLDVGCGTGDMLRAFAHGRPAPRMVLGVDFSAGMLAHARLDGAAVPIYLVRGDGLRLPLGDATVDVISCAFGLRNLADLHAGLEEMARVARAGARIVLLEFALPENRVLRWAYQFYCDVVLPRLGAWIARDRSGAYRYLPRSISTFDTAGGMIRRLLRAGFRDVTLRRMNFGGVVLYRAVKPAR